MLIQLYAAALTVAAPATPYVAAAIPAAVPSDPSVSAVPATAQPTAPAAVVEVPTVPPAAAPQAPSPPDTVDAPDQPDQSAIVVTGSSHRIDPFQAVNATSFVAVQAVDKALIGPLAHGYEHILPVPVRAGIHHFLLNVHEPIIFVNFLLQLKLGKAAATAARFAINSTVGIGGLLEVAAHRPFKLIHRENGFANTLGYYGVKPGAYLYLPLLGPTTVRDLIGFSIDRLSTPFLLGRFVPVLKRPAVAIPVALLRTLDRRVDLEPDLAAFRKSDNPYQAERKWYLDRRQAEIDALHHRTQPAPAITAQPLAAHAP